MRVEVELNHGIEQMMGCVDVVGDGVILVLIRLHRIGRGPLLGKVE